MRAREERAQVGRPFFFFQSDLNCYVYSKIYIILVLVIIRWGVTKTSLRGAKNVFMQETLWSSVETSQFKRFQQSIHFVSRSRIIQSLQPFFDLMRRDWP